MSRAGTLIASFASLAAVAALTAAPTTAAPAPAASTPASNPEPAPDGYPEVGDVGFHHLALLYHDAGHTAASYLPYVNRVTTSGAVVPGEPLFDAFLALSFTAPTGASMDYGRLTVADWVSTLDLWFGPDGNPSAGMFAKLDQAVELAGGGPSDVRDVVVMMPWMSGEQRDFGDLGDGQGSRDLADPADRRAVAAWFTGLVAAEFAAAGYDHLELWGMYRMREDVTPWERAPLGPGGAPVAASDAQGIRDADPDLGYLFIPYYNAPGWDTWRDYGFTTAILQPSYAFRGVMDGGRVDAGRLRATAHQAATHGLGVEIEVRGCQSMPQERAVLQGYLAAGTTYGYQQAPTAYFLGENLATCGAVTSADPAQRAAYDAVADYAGGDPIPWPDVAPAWAHTVAGSTHTWTATGVDPGAANGVRIELTEPNLAQAWRGTAEVLVRPAGGPAWTAAGWSVRGAPDAPAAARQSVAVPVDQDALQPATVDVQVRLTTAPSSPVATPAVDRLVLDPGLAPSVVNAAAHARVVVESPANPTGRYADPSGTKLTDRVVSDRGWTADLDVGWTSDPGQAAVVVDLGAAYPVERVRLYGQGGSDAGVNWPVNPVVLLGSTAPAAAPEGAGAAPAGLRAVPFGPPVVTGRHASGLPSTLPLACGDPGAPDLLCTNQDGYLDATTAPVTSRYVTVFLGSTGWAMLSELEVYAGGTRITPAGYRLYRHPNGDGESYVDDGLRLVDGAVADDFKWKMFSGWPGDRQVTLRLDLPAARDVAGVTLWTAQLDRFGIVQPSGFTVQVTTDGQTWQPYPGAVTTQSFGTGGRRLVLTGAATADDVTGVRIVLPGDHAGWAWHMLSEITLDPASPAAAERTSGSAEPRRFTAAAGARLTGAGFVAGERVDVTLDGTLSPSGEKRPSVATPLGQVVADGRGRVAAAVPVPPSVRPGGHRLRLTGTVGGDQVESVVVVMPPRARPGR